MNLEDQVPVLILHVLEADITENASIVDQDVNPSKGLDGSLDNGLSVLYTVIVGYGLAASSFDLLDDGVGGLYLVSE